MEYLGEGFASYYADKFQGMATASGVPYDSLSYSAAHPSLPFGSKLLVTNIQNERKIEVVINDRGPFLKNRIIDLSKAAAKELKMIDTGVIKVRLQLVK
jgi:rare lipoprotein A